MVNPMLGLTHPKQIGKVSHSQKPLVPTNDLQCEANSYTPHPAAVFANTAQAGLEPINPMCISSPPTGPLHFAVTEQYAKDYVMLFPNGIDVPSPAEGQPPVHFA
eukprot:scaffold14407_cov169-Isochrysis_galbana.AAC.1